MTSYQENFCHAQEPQKQAYNKSVKPRSYIPGNKVWLNSKYIKTKQNCKLESKFFGPFQVLHLVGNQAYKLKPLKKWRIYDVFHISLLEQDTTRKEQVEDNMTQLEFETGDEAKYKVEAIWNSAIYARKLQAGHLLGVYDLILWKDYPKEENTWEPASAVQYL